MHEARGGTSWSVRVVPEMRQGFPQLCHSIANFPAIGAALPEKPARRHSAGWDVGRLHGCGRAECLISQFRLRPESCHKNPLNYPPEANLLFSQLRRTFVVVTHCLH